MLAVGGGPRPAATAPGAPGAGVAVRHIPEWLGAEAASRLALGFDVLVPSSVPAPFAGEPAVNGSGGSYGLYWMMPGTPPTFLEVTGTVGGEIPAYSWYDRNVQLMQNASIQGYPAWHDLTPIYDLVYWQVGDVVYSVNSQGLTDVDSLAVANGLVTLVPSAPPAPVPEDTSDGVILDSEVDGNPDSDSGAAEEEPVEGGSDGGEADGQGPVAPVPNVEAAPAPVEAPAPADGPPAAGPSVTLGAPESVQAGEVAAIGVEGITGALLVADAGVFVATGDGRYAGVGGFAVEWLAPVVAGDLLVTFALVDPENGSTQATAQTLVLGEDDPAPTLASLAGPNDVVSGELVYVTLSGDGLLVVDASVGVWPEQSPNTLFDPDAAGDATLVGSLPAGGTATLVWRAPDVAVATRAMLYATDRSGETTATWELTVRPGDLRPNPTPQPIGAGGMASAARPPGAAVAWPPNASDVPDPGPDFSGGQAPYPTTDGTEGPRPDPNAPTPTAG